MLVTTVEYNKHKYTSTDYKRAVLARKIQILIRRPSLQVFLHYLDNSLIPNCPIDRNDAIAANDIFGKDLGEIKGKTT